ncbi:prohead protease/major capsid protein fusion protein [Pseudomonas fluorescens]|uniref:Bacteriophage Mu GpT domain-containing protein n=1 Tax=Pseudomonas fluorescens TaxID=294 RepID=A0A5E7QE06_PSEFL|nr:prohead protease/major capsid protein fusion protein [Pseudomonas fluorescens]VVP57173.1 hypothetical protein PS880_05788 [Pseudomonas fluorescens]
MTTKTKPKPDGQAVTQRQTPAFQVRAAIRPETMNIENRTVEVVFSTGSRGLRWSWEVGEYLEELEISESAIDMTRMNNGAPLLDSHQRYDLSSVIGVVERAWVEGELAIAEVRFAEDEASDLVYRKVVGGIIRNLSVGYFVNRYAITDSADNVLPIYRAVDWEPFEVSFVPVGFDSAATVRELQACTRAADYKGQLHQTEFPTRQADPVDHLPAIEGDIMTEEEKRAAEEKARIEREAELKAASDRAVETERTRVASVRTIGERVGLDPKELDAIVARNLDVGASGEAILEVLAKRHAEQPKTVTGQLLRFGVGPDMTMREAMTGMIRNRVRPGSVEVKPEWKQYRGMNLVAMGAECIRAAGGDPRGMTPREIAMAAMNSSSQQMRAAGMHSTSDFPLILANSIGKVLLAAYAAAPQQFRDWTSRTTVPDFKEVALVSLGDLSPFKKVNEGGEYKYGTFGENGGRLKVEKWGEIIAITWEAIVNDDLGVFDRIPTMLGRAAMRKESDIVWDLLLSNPELPDGNTVFSVEHGNFTTPGTPINTESLALGREMMASQTSESGEALSIVPRFLIVGPKQSLAAYQYTSSNYTPNTPAAINDSRNANLVVIVEGRIVDYRWYLMADPADVNSIDYAYLEGEEGVFIETREGFEVDGLETKARLVFGATWVDYRGAYLNLGAPTPAALAAPGGGTQAAKSTK